VSIIADTNVIVRAIMLDPPAEGRKAMDLLRSDQVVVPTVVFCEMVWVLRRVYKLSRLDVMQAFRAILGVGAITFDRLAVEAGLSMMEAGGDFADGVIAFEGRRLGGSVFATFDRKAAGLIGKSGHDSFLVATE